MSLGNEIILSSEPRGVFKEGIISGTPKPGTCMQVQAGTAKVAGRFTWEAYAPGTDGEQRLITVLLPDSLQGKLATDAYVTGTRGFLYCPIPGEELNMLYLDVAGTADDHTIGQVHMVDTGTGKLIATTGSPESEAFVCLEATTDPAADFLAHSMFTGY